MIIWRGWGGTSLIIIVLGVVVASFATPESLHDTMIPGAIGVIIGGLATVAVGYWLNIIRPNQRQASYLAQRTAELHYLADTGQFHRGPGHPAPTSVADARAQASQLAAEEAAGVARRNVNTLFFIPMQYVGIAAAAIGVALLVYGLVSG